MCCITNRYNNLVLASSGSCLKVYSCTCSGPQRACSASDVVVMPRYFFASLANSVVADLGLSRHRPGCGFSKNCVQNPPQPCMHAVPLVNPLNFKCQLLLTSFWGLPITKVDSMAACFLHILSYLLELKFTVSTTRKAS